MIPDYDIDPVGHVLEALRSEVSREQSKAIWAEVVKMLDGELSIAAIAPGVLPALERLKARIAKENSSDGSYKP